MEETVDVQGNVIGVGTLVAVGLWGYGIFISETIAGIAATTAAAWTFAATFVAVALVHGSVGQYNLSLGFVGAAAGLLFVFVGEPGTQTLVGLFLLLVSGVYIALLTVRARRDEAGTDTGSAP